MGVPTVGGEVQFHPSYGSNILVNAFNLGLVPSDGVFLGQATGVGNPVIYAGARTGRDGIHGATMASDSFDDEAMEKRPTVQVGDPFTEKCVLEACLELFAENLVVGIQDMGAAGLTCSTFEMADRAGTGIALDLDRIPTRESGMTPYEILLSESQERMLLVCVPENADRVREIFEKWGLSCVICGEVTDDGRVKVTHQGQVVVDLPASPLSDEAPVYNRPSAEPVGLAERRQLNPTDFQSRDPKADLMALVASPNLSSRRFIYRQYDHMVRVGTRVGPGADAALIRVVGTDKALAMTVDCNGRYVWLDPHEGAAMAIAEGVRNLACVGAEPIGATDCLNFGNPERPETMWEFSGAIDGLKSACEALAVPIIGGNVSFYNETDEEGIIPTPSVGVVGLLESVEEDWRNPSAAFRDDEQVVAVLGHMAGETLGGSEYLFALHGETRGVPPRCRLDDEQAVSGVCRTLVRGGLVSSAHDVSDGGLLTALAECTGCHEGSVKVGAKLAWASDDDRTMAFFGEAGARIVISFPKANATQIEAAAQSANVPLTVLGTTGGDTLSVALDATDGTVEFEADTTALYEAWSTGLTQSLGIDA